MNNVKCGLIFFAASFIFAVNGQNSFANHESGQVAKVDWVARYDARIGYDFAEDLVVDSAGNVYVTGYSGVPNSQKDDIKTIKYDSKGNQLWVATYDSGFNTIDRAFVIALDSKGFVYIAGFTNWGANTRGIFTTIKYDPADGKLKWIRTYSNNGWNSSVDTANAIVIDKEDNIYVTGYSAAETSYTDFTTIKYDENGNQKWIAHYNGTGNKFDQAIGIVLDSAGDVIVTGNSQNESSEYAEDYVTIKYNQVDGSERWVRRYNGEGDSFDIPSGIVIDLEDNVYVTGVTYGPDYQDYQTIKYDKDGNDGWAEAAIYDGFHNTDWSYALAVDNENNLYVTGYSYDGSQSDFATIKYNAITGEKIWVRYYNNQWNKYDSARDLTLDNQGNIYVIGRSWHNLDFYNANGVFTVLKYNKDGNEIWVNQFDYAQPQRSSDEEPKAITVDSLGNVYTIGFAYGGSERDMVTTKYLQLPTVAIDLQEYDNVLHRGEDLQYQLTLTNNSDRDQVVDYWSQIKARDGSIREAVAPTPISLAPNGTYTTEFSHAIPGKSPKGRYEYLGYVGEDIEHIWDEDMFPFSIVPSKIFDLNVKEGAR